MPSPSFAPAAPRVRLLGSDGQALDEPALYDLGGLRFRLVCKEWSALSPESRLARAEGILLFLPKGALPEAVAKGFDAACGQATDGYVDLDLRPRVAPAGQALSLPVGTRVDASGNIRDASGAVVGYDFTGATQPSTAVGGRTLTPAQVGGILSTAGRILGESGRTIAAAIDGGRQVELARLDGTTRVRLAQMLADQQAAAAAGDTATAARIGQDRSTLQALLDLIAAQNSQGSNHTGLYVAAGAAAVALVAVVALSHRGPSTGKSKR